MADMSARFTQEARDAIEAYLAEVNSELGALRSAECREALSDVAQYFDEQLPLGATSSDVESVISGLGTPHEFAVGILRELGGRPKRESEGAASTAPANRASRGFGKVFGVPFDVRVPTVSRIGSRWWDPANPDIFVPRVFGAGWDINFGAVAVALGLIRPDDEDEPFGAVPDRAFLFALIVPVALTAFVAGVALATSGRLPAQLPAHWGIGGRPDNFWSRQSVFAFDLALAAIPTAYAVFCVAARRSRAQRAASIALASLMSVLAAFVYALSVAWAFGVSFPYLTLVMIFAALAAPFAQLTILARIGRAEERRRDISGSDRKDAS